MNNVTNLTPEQLIAALEAARAENELLKAKDAKRQTLTMKVSEKGAMSLYGMGRFPISLYAQQWERIFTAQEEIKAFLAANKGKLAVKE